ncbi:MAG: right-handed parallel beta-helix repeat-containing protein [Gemmataceae bacterium]
MSNVRDFGARGDGRADDTQAILHALSKGDGHLFFPRGDYVVSRPIPIPLQTHGRTSIEGAGGAARLLMTGAGPCLHLIGTHTRNADPTSFAEGVWERERMPTIRGIEIVGKHDEADGIRLEGTMQSTLHNVLIRRCRHGVHLKTRTRNVLLSDCHIYDCNGIGVFFDRINLHQTNIIGSHISYCKRGGIVIVGSEIRNLQITGCDIEYNFDPKADASADVFFDCREGTVREGTITSCTIQAKDSPGGANVRFVGDKDHPNAVGLFAISGNLIGSQSKALDLHACRAVAVTGNTIYSGYRHSIWAEDCEHLVFSGNSIDHNPEYKGNSTDQMVIKNCRNVNITGLLMQHTLPATAPVTESVKLMGCRNVSIVGAQMVNARRRGIVLENCSAVRIADSTIRGKQGDADYETAIAFGNDCSDLMITNNMLGRGTAGAFRLAAERGASNGNMMIDNG